MGVISDIRGGAITFMSRDDPRQRRYFDVIAVARSDRGWELKSGLCKR